MVETAQASVSTLVFAAIVAILLFGAFLNRAVRLALRSWWHRLHILPFDKRDEAEIFPRRVSEKKERDRASPHVVRPHVEKKATPIHRQG